MMTRTAISRGVLIIALTAPGCSAKAAKEDRDDTEAEDPVPMPAVNEKAEKDAIERTVVGN